MLERGGLLARKKTPPSAGSAMSALHDQVDRCQLTARRGQISSSPAYCVVTNIKCFRLKRWSSCSGRTFKASVSVHARSSVSGGLKKLVTALPVLASIARIFCFTFSDSNVPSKHQAGSGTLGSSMGRSAGGADSLSKNRRLQTTAGDRVRKIVPLQVDKIMSYLYYKNVAKRRRIELNHSAARTPRGGFIECRRFS